MIARLCMTVVLSAAVLGLAGCGPPKLDERGSKTLTMGDFSLLELPKVGQPQKITIEVEATEPVNVYVIDSSIKDGFENLSKEKQEAAAKYGKKMQVTKDSLSADVPANTGVTVAIGGAMKKTEMKYSLSNRK